MHAPANFNISPSFLLFLGQTRPSGSFDRPGCWVRACERAKGVDGEIGRNWAHFVLVQPPFFCAQLFWFDTAYSLARLSLPLPCLTNPLLYLVFWPKPALRAAQSLPYCLRNLMMGDNCLRKLGIA